ncbi:NAD(+) synthase [Clostridium brassicae]|uniref:NH(3)-dependent NAD(+) synthetase n=1 Tax=Clostridium brassicae TaxID=2999072 RepID=A0ABT4DDY3_9CLOT|nr:NAD(+) synthase [Clostridium brassicae]MCY6960521.1 NAD(+) synthase [Clostridium brassicae]
MEERIIQFIKNIVNQHGYKGVIIGISGGIDSAVVAALCVKALGKDKVYGILLPERDSAGDTVSDAKLVCKTLGIKYNIISISPVLKDMGIYSMEHNFYFIPRKIKQMVVMRKWKALSKTDAYLEDLYNKGSGEFLRGISYYRVKHRIRMCYLYMEGEKRGYAVMGTTNKTEYLTGFYVKWGDDAVDIEPLLHLYKSQVFQLAKKMNIPEKIISKPPSPDLIPGITDEYALGISYEELDRILEKIENRRSLLGEDRDKIKRVKDLMSAAKNRNIRMLSIK